MNEIRRQVGQRLKHEPPLVHSRVREDRIRALTHQLVVEDDIQVKRPRGVRFRADAAEHAFDFEKGLQKPFGREQRVGFDNRIEICSGVGRSANGRGLVIWGNATNGEAGQPPAAGRSHRPCSVGGRPDWSRVPDRCASWTSRTHRAATPRAALIWSFLCRSGRRRGCPFLGLALGAFGGLFLLRLLEHDLLHANLGQTKWAAALDPLFGVLQLLDAFRPRQTRCDLRTRPFGA